MIVGETASSYVFPNIISGQRFHYTFCDKSCGEIWQSIEALDKMVSS